MEKLKYEVIQLVGKLFIERGYSPEIIEYANFIDDLGMDSITFITMVVELERVFKIIIPDEILSMEYFKNVDDIVDVINQYHSNLCEESHIE